MELSLFIIENVAVAVVACPATVTSFRCETMFASERLTACKVDYFIFKDIPTALVTLVTINWLAYANVFSDEISFHLACISGIGNGKNT